MRLRLLYSFALSALVLLITLLAGFAREDTPDRPVTGAVPAVLDVAVVAPTLVATFVDEDHGWLWTGRHLFTTSDAGRHWHQLPIPPESDAPRFTSPREGWVASGARLFATRDGGATWLAVGSPVATSPGDAGQPRIRSFQFVDPQHGWVGVEDLERPPPLVFYRTRDGGSTWDELREPCPDPLGLGKLMPGTFAFADAERGWMVCRDLFSTGTGARLLFQTSDGGEHWTRVAAIDDFAGPLLPRNWWRFVDRERGFRTEQRDAVATDYETTDGGQTWRPIRRLLLPSTNTRLVPANGYETRLRRYLAVGEAPPDGWDAPRRFALYWTEDGGATWTRRFPGDPSGPPPPCGAAALVATFRGWGPVTGGQLSSAIDLENGTAAPCTLRGRPQVVVRDAQGRITAADPRPPDDADGQETSVLRTGERARVWLSGMWADHSECDERKVPSPTSARVRPAFQPHLSLRLRLPNGEELVAVPSEGQWGPGLLCFLRNGRLEADEPSVVLR